MAIDTISGSICSHDEQKKGARADRYLVDTLVGDTEWLGYSQIFTKRDNEPAIAQLRENAPPPLKANSVHPASCDSKANGAVDNAAKQLQG